MFPSFLAFLFSQPENSLLLLDSGADTADAPPLPPFKRALQRLMSVESVPWEGEFQMVRPSSQQLVPPVIEAQPGPVNEPDLGENGDVFAGDAAPAPVPPPAPTTTDLWRKMFGRADYLGHLRSEVGFFWEY